jgi:predicted nuclease of predicted toxin-antitoxin system
VKLVLDMNLSPAWVSLLASEDWEVVHWSSVGSKRAPDVEIMNWASARGYCVVTSDLDFTAILAATGAGGPSVVQIRAQDLVPAVLGETLVRVIRDNQEHLLRGALVTLDVRGARLRRLPLP